MSRCSDFLIALLTLAGGSAIADTNERSVCAEGDKWYPDGRVVVIGDRKFFTCNGDLGGHFDDQTVLVHDSIRARNEAFVLERTRIDGSAPEYRGLITEYRAFVPNRPTSHVQVSDITIEDVTYDVYVLESRADETRGLVAEGELPDWAIYFAERTDTVPEHYLHCTAPPLPALTLVSSCSLDIRFAPGEDVFVVASYGISSGFAPDTFGGRPLSLENVPAYVRDVHRAFSVMEEVAASVDELDPVSDP